MIIIIVGASGPKWAKGQGEKAINLISHILGSIKNSNELIIDNISFLPNGDLDAKLKLIEYDSLTVVSSHSPVGKKRNWCLLCQGFISENKVKNHLISNPDGVYKIFDEGGIATMVEMAAYTHDISLKIFPAPAKQWNDRSVEIPSRIIPLRLSGYNSRNIQMAEFGLDTKEHYILYDIEPAKSCSECDGSGWDYKKRQEEGPFSFPRCQKCGGDGASSNGTLILNHAKRLGREVIKIVIE